MRTMKNTGIQKFLALGALLILIIFFSIFGYKFATFETAINILDKSYFIGFLAIGVTFVIITGGIDLSIGAVMMCSALIGGIAYNVWALPMWLCLIIMVSVGLAFGLINGILISKLKLPPFIATLGTMMISMGLASIISNVQTQRFPQQADADGWFKTVFFKTPGNLIDGGGLPTGVLYLGIFFVIAFIVLNRTKIGRYIFAIGSNEEAVRLSGVKADFWKMLAYTISGLFAGLSSIVYAATYSTIIPGTGNGLELEAIAAVVIGGTSLSGGVGSLSGTIIGVLIMSTLKTGLVSMNLPPYWQTFFTGIVVIAAVLMDIYRNKKSRSLA